ncbi:signal peptidase II [Streptococcus acidominimus]|uniref:Lipoprotein signal peptidase n=1 Tax=Streptococcus acidominimus TaxID=1326 RepID=A0A4Y9FPS5_STRAI|nr:signal peptidase II [Streptococcus acidominimus]MBF0818441.1 signal peptidase II [Streptococcus acidominimus]MBF0838031.1 signal peptidase II [Streptococcus acidominimus]MBF0848507.1 signal peptidase II [Streptococcus danieliae]TFU31224.1 signal peptidase II [Streptococcus acidominimus]
MRKIGFPLGMVVLIALDQWVKAWTVARLALNEQRTFIPKLLNLYYLRNYGAAYSILQNQQWFFTVVTLVVMSVAIWYFIKHIKGSLWLLSSLSLVIAGGIGNFIDRLRLGYVVDMFHLDFIDFPVFNVADICLTVGVAILFIYMMKEEKNGSKS